MNIESWDIDYDLRAWAEWSRFQSGAKIGYPTIQPFTRMKSPTGGYVPDHNINDDYAMVVDKTVGHLKPLNYDLFCVINLYYLLRLNQREVAKQLGWSSSQVKNKLTTARDVVKGMIMVLQQNAGRVDLLASV